MLQPLHRLRRADQAAGAAADRIALLADGVGLPHSRAMVGKAIGLRRRAGGATGRHRRSSGSRRPRGRPAPSRPRGCRAPSRIGLPLRIAAGDVILVVQRGVRHDDAAHRHRRKPRHGRQRPGAADLDVDGLRSRVQASSAGNLCAMAQRGVEERKPSRALQGKVVHLVDHAVDVIAQRRPLRLDQRGTGPASPRARRTARSAGWSGNPSAPSRCDGAHLGRRPAAPTARPRHRQRTAAGARR